MLDLMPLSSTNASILNDLNDFEKTFFSPTYSRSSFRIDILDKKDCYVLEAELPGFAKENISINVDGEYLTIKATKDSKNSSTTDEEATYVRKERTYGSYERSFHIPNINANEVEAAYNNGMLHVTMPKVTADKKNAKQIPIK